MIVIYPHFLVYFRQHGLEEATMSLHPSTLLVGFRIGCGTSDAILLKENLKFLAVQFCT